MALMRVSTCVFGWASVAWVLAAARFVQGLDRACSWVAIAAPEEKCSLSRRAPLWAGAVRPGGRRCGLRVGTGLVLATAAVAGAALMGVAFLVPVPGESRGPR